MPPDDPLRAPHVSTPNRRVGLRHLTPLPVVADRRHLDTEVRSDIRGRPPLRGEVGASFHIVILASDAL